MIVDRTLALVGAAAVLVVLAVVILPAGGGSRPAAPRTWSSWDSSACTQALCPLGHPRRGTWPR